MKFMPCLALSKFGRRVGKGAVPAVSASEESTVQVVDAHRCLVEVLHMPNSGARRHRDGAGSLGGVRTAQKLGPRAKSGTHRLQALLGLQLQGQSGADATKAGGECSEQPESLALLGRLKPLVPKVAPQREPGTYGHGTL
jgi:hypothetical protein